MICKKCGSEITERTAFCTECGAPLVWEDETKTPETPNQAPAAPSAPVYAAPAAPQMTAQPYAPAYAPQQPYAAPAYAQPAAPKYATTYAPQPVKEKKKGNGGKIALLVTTILLALALIGGGIFGYLLYQQKTGEINSLSAEKAELEDQLAQEFSENNALADDYNDLSAKYDALTEDYGELSAQFNDLAAEEDKMRDSYEFYTKFGVICSDMNKYYHTYECEDWDRSAFWIYNLDAAKGKDFTPCPVCHEGE